MAETTKLKILSVNVKGMKENKRQRAIREFAEEKKYDIVMVQESWLEAKDDIRSTFQKDWRIDRADKPRQKSEAEYVERKTRKYMGKYKLNEKRAKRLVNPRKAVGGCGVVTLTRNQWNPQTIKTFRDLQEGRFIISYIKVNKERMLLITNLYAPTSNVGENDNFFERLLKILTQKRKECEKEFKKVDLILAGDFNNIEDYKVDKKIEIVGREYSGYCQLKKKLELVDIFRREHPNERKFTYIHSDEEKRGQETRIDRFLLSKNLNGGISTDILDFDARISGDHRPIELELEVETKGIKEIDRSRYRFPNRPRLRTKKSYNRLKRVLLGMNVSKDTGIRELLKSLREGAENGHFAKEKIVSNVISRLEKNIYDGLKEEIGEKMKPKYRLKNGAFTNDPKYINLRELRDELRALEKMMKGSKPKGLMEETMIEVQKRIKRGKIELTIADKDNETGIALAIKQVGKHMKERIDEMGKNRIQAHVDILRGSEHTDSNLFWKKVKNEVREYSNLTHITIDEGGEEVKIDEPEEILEKWRGYWQEVFRQHKEDSQPSEGLKYMDRKRNGDVMEVETKFSEERYQEAKRRQTNFKSPGESNIPVEVYKSLTGEDDKMIKDIFEIIWEREIIPESWRRSLIQFIEKKGDNTKLSNWRPISLLDTLYKIFSAMVYDNLKEFIEKNEILNDLQFGFREGKSISQALLTLISAIEDSNQFKREIHVLKLDFSKAFDSMERWAMIKTLRGYGVPEKLVRIIEEIHRGNTATLLTPLGIPKKDIKIERGVRQGDVLSPLLFILFINPLLDKLEKSGFGYSFTKNNNIRIPHVCFADDLTLIGGSAEDLRNMMKIVLEFCKETGMKLNEEKCEYTFKSYDKEVFVDTEIIINGKVLTPIEHNKATRLLGILHNLDGDWEEDEKERLSKIEWRLSELYGRCFTLKQKVKIINLMFTPRVRFAMNCIKMTEETLKEIDRKNVRFLRVETGSTPSLHEEKFFDPLTINLDSLLDEQDSSFVSTIYNNGFNTKGKYPKVCLLQRGVDDDKYSKNTTREFEETLAKYNFKIAKEDALRQKLFTYKPFEPKEYLTLKDEDGKEKNALFTDGSYREKDKKAAAAVILGRTSDKNLFFRAEVDESSLGAEFEAVLAAVQVSPEGASTLIFIDCLNVILMVERKDRGTQEMKSRNRTLIKEIRKELNRKRATGADIELVWIPSHTRERGGDQLNEKKRARLLELEQRFKSVKGQWDTILAGNEAADSWAKMALQLESKGSIRIPTEAAEFPLINIERGKVWEGNLKSEIKKKQKLIHKVRVDEQVEKYYGAEEIDRSMLTLVFGDKRPEMGGLQKFFFRLLYGGLKSPNNNFDVKDEEERFKELRKQYIYSTDMCEVEGCKGMAADTKHICLDCAVVRNKTWENIKQKAENIINEMTGKKVSIEKWYDDVGKPNIEEEEEEKEEQEKIEDNKNSAQERTTKKRKKNGEEDAEEARKGKRQKIEEKKENGRILNDKRTDGEPAEVMGVNKTDRASESRPKRRRGDEDGDYVDEAPWKKARTNVNMNAMDDKGGSATGKDKGSEKPDRKREELKEKRVLSVEDEIEIGDSGGDAQVDKAAIGEKLTTLMRIEKRKKAEGKREARKKKIKRLSSKAYGSRGYVNKELLSQVDRWTKKNEEKEKILKDVICTLLEQVMENYRKFWESHWDKLKKDGINVRKLNGSKKAKDTTIT